MSILVTGGAGFVGCLYLCRIYKENYPNAHVVAFDNFHRGYQQSEYSPWEITNNNQLN